jgi:hypothetical protein
METEIIKTIQEKFNLQKIDNSNNPSLFKRIISKLIKPKFIILFYGEVIGDKKSLNVNNCYKASEIKHNNDNDSLVFVSPNSYLEEQISNRQLIIYATGNVINGNDFVNNIQEHELQNSDLVALNYPNKINSSRDVINYYKAAINSLIESGYKPENITLKGHSMGAGLLSVALSEINLKSGQKFAAFDNYYGFTNPAESQLNKPGFVNKILLFIANNLFKATDFDINVKKVFDKAQLPVNKITLYRASNDNTILKDGLIATYVDNKNNNKNNNKYTVINVDGDHFVLPNDYLKPQVKIQSQTEESKVQMIQSTSFREALGKQNPNTQQLLTRKE